MNCSTLTIRVAYINHSFFIYPTANSNKTFEPGGVEYLLLNILSHHFKFKFELITPADGEWGAQIRGKRWSGMIGLLLNNEADIAISSISMTPARQKVVDFSVPYAYDALTFITRSRKVPYPRKVFFLLPFSPVVWVLVAVAFVLCSIVLLMFQLVYSKFNLKWKPPRTWKLLQIVAKQDLDLQSFRSSKTISSRFLLGSWLVSVGVLIQYYCGMLTSTVSVAKTMPTIDTVDALAHAVSSGVFQMGMLRGNAFEDMILGATSYPLLVFREAITNSQNFQYPKSPKDAVMRVAHGNNFVYLEQKRSLEMLIEEFKVVSEVNFPKENFFVDRLAIAFRKDFNKDFCRSLSQLIRRLGATGILRKLNTQHKLHSNEGRDKTETQNYIDLQDLQSVFYLMLLGYDVAFLVFIIEFTYNRLSLYKLRLHRNRDKTVLYHSFRARSSR